MFFELPKLLKYLSYFLYLFAFVILIRHYWTTGIGTEEKFKTLIALFGSLSIFFTIYNFLLQNQRALESSKSTSIKFYSDSFKDILDETVKFFVQHPDMNYYYKDLFTNDASYKEDERNRVLEHQLTTIIISRAGPIIRFIDDYKTNNRDDFYFNEVLVVEANFKKLLGSFFGSKIFVQNYDAIKNGITSQLTRKYIEKNFKK
jgi:hypothetical protein